MVNTSAFQADDAGSIPVTCSIYAAIAQWVEHFIGSEEVADSSSANSSTCFQYAMVHWLQALSFIKIVSVQRYNIYRPDE